MFSSLLQNNLRGGDMFFEMEKPKSYPRLLCFEQHYDTEGNILHQPPGQIFYFFSIRKTKYRWSFSLWKNEEDRSVTSTFYDFTEIAVSCYTRLVLKVETIDSPLKMCFIF